MGAATSKAETLVNSCINVAVEIVTDDLTTANANTVQNQSIICSHCGICDIHDIDWSVDQMVDLSAIQNVFTDGSMQADIQQKIQAWAESSAEAGILYADSKSQVIENIALQLSMAITSIAKSITEASMTQDQSIVVEHCEEAHIYLIHWKASMKNIQTSIQKSEHLADVKATLVQDVEAHSESEAKGFDPTLLVVAIVIVIVIFVFGGFDIIAANILKPSVWFLISLLITAFGGWKLLSGYTHNPIYPGDTDAQKKKKEGWHRKDKKMGFILTGVGLIASVLTSFIFITSKKK